MNKITLDLDSEKLRKEAMKAFMAIRKQSAKNFPKGLSLEEINEEIAKVRRGECDE